MTGKMTHGNRAELTNAIRGRYRAAAGKGKRGILEECPRRLHTLQKRVKTWRRGASSGSLPEKTTSHHTSS
jgi:hypothetical protein